MVRSQRTLRTIKGESPGVRNPVSLINSRDGSQNNVRVGLLLYSTKTVVFDHEGRMSAPRSEEAGLRASLLG